MSKFKEYLEVLKDSEKGINDENNDDISSKIYDQLEKELALDVNKIILKARKTFNTLKKQYNYKGTIDDFMDDAYGWAGGKNDPEDIRVIEAALFGRK